MKKLLVLLIACLALTVTGCGGDDDDDGGDSGGGATTTEQTDTGAAEQSQTGASTLATVDMKDIKFVPADLTVPAGTTVTWTNSDEVPHTVTKSDGPGPDFDSGNVDGGGEFEQTFNDAGTINYECTIHPGQTGSITVE